MTIVPWELVAMSLTLVMGQNQHVIIMTQITVARVVATSRAHPLTLASSSFC